MSNRQSSCGVSIAYVYSGTNLAQLCCCLQHSHICTTFRNGYGSGQSSQATANDANSQSLLRHDSDRGKESSVRARFS